MPLTDVSCRNAKPRGRAYKLTDGEGLHLLVQPNGSRLWRLAYRFDRKQKTASLGPYPMVGLAEAREKRLAARKLLLGGIDPAVAREEQRRARRLAAANTFEAVAREWHDCQRNAWVPGHADRVMSRLERDAFPLLGSRQVNEIEAPDILEAIRKVEKRGAFDIAKRANQTISAVMRFAIATGRATRDPAADLRGALRAPPKVKHHAALPEADLAEFVSRLDGYEGEPRTRLALKLTLLTFVRSSEVRFAAWSEFERLETEEPLWRIPAERMKAGREHLVPLAPQTVEVLRDLRELAGRSAFVFPAPAQSGVISENTMIYALYRLGYRGRLTVHGFRRMASTILNEAGFNSDWIERQLAHVHRDKIRRAYNAAEWLAGRRQMMAWWADKVTARPNAC